MFDSRTGRAGWNPRTRTVAGWRSLTVVER
jgi:hypothetical protein